MAIASPSSLGHFHFENSLIISSLSPTAGVIYITAAAVGKDGRAFVRRACSPSAKRGPT
jgi:hypothetical protein